MQELQQERPIYTFDDLNLDVKQRIADMLGSRQNAANLKFLSKSIMGDMPDYFNCFSLPASHIILNEGDNAIDVHCVVPSLLKWNHEVKRIEPTQRYPCIKIENRSVPWNLCKCIQMCSFMFGRLGAIVSNPWMSHSSFTFTIPQPPGTQRW
jgi:hypothetical protein